MLSKKATLNAESLELYPLSDFQPITYSIPLSTFYSNTSNVG